MDPATLTAIWTFLKKFGLPIMLVLSVLAANHERKAANEWEGKYTASEANRKTDREAYNLALADATQKNEQQVKATETKWKLVVKENADAYQSKLNAAYATVRSYAERMRQQAVTSPQGSSGGSEVPGITNPSDVPYGAGEGALVPTPIGDLNICAANTVKAKGWQDFWIGFSQSYPPK